MVIESAKEEKRLCERELTHENEKKMKVVVYDGAVAGSENEEIKIVMLLLLL